MTAPYPFQSLGDADALIPTKDAAWIFPEFATVTPLLSNGTTTRNAVIQSTGPTFRQKAVVWVLAESSVVAIIRGYAEDKTPQTYTEEDGTTRTVVVMNFEAPTTFGGADTDAIREMHATLLEMSDPVSGS